MSAYKYKKHSRVNLPPSNMFACQSGKRYNKWMKSQALKGLRDFLHTSTSASQWSLSPSNKKTKSQKLWNIFQLTGSKQIPRISSMTVGNLNEKERKIAVLEFVMYGCALVLYWYKTWNVVKLNLDNLGWGQKYSSSSKIAVYYQI